jgi:D-alanyl-D-alanine carboxypeptidase
MHKRKTHNIMKKLLLTLTIALTYAASAHAQIAPVYQGRFQQVLDSVCQKNKIKGISAAIMIPNEGIWTGVYGESHSGVPITKDMYLPIGSNTKTYVAAMMLKLQEDGLLSLDDTIGKWFQNVPNVNGQITIRQMLNHTSGLYSYTDTSAFFTALNSDYTKVWQPEEMLPFISTPEFAPGTSWSYSNTNYLLAGLIIKQIRNESLAESVRKMILNPQGFSHTATYPAEKAGITIPHGWSTDGNPAQLTDMMDAYNYDNTAFLSMATSAGALVANAEDLVKFWDALMTGKIINSNSLAEMKTLVKLNANNGYGLGVMWLRPLNGRTGYSHGGTCFGYLNENFIDSATGVAICILSNQDSVDNNKLLTRVVAALHKETVKMPPTGITQLAYEGINIYPNPATDRIYVTLPNSNEAELELVDITGRMAYRTQLKNGSNEIRLPDVNSGLYIARVTENGTLAYQQKIQVIK